MTLKKLLVSLVLCTLLVAEDLLSKGSLVQCMQPTTGTSAVKNSENLDQGSVIATFYPIRRNPGKRFGHRSIVHIDAIYHIGGSYNETTK